MLAGSSNFVIFWECLFMDSTKKYAHCLFLFGPHWYVLFFSGTVLVGSGNTTTLFYSTTTTYDYGVRLRSKITKNTNENYSIYDFTARIEFYQYHFRFILFKPGRLSAGTRYQVIYIFFSFTTQQKIQHSSVSASTPESQF